MFFVHRATDLLQKVDIHPCSISERVGENNVNSEESAKSTLKFQNLGKRGRQ